MRGYYLQHDRTDNAHDQTELAETLMSPITVYAGADSITILDTNPSTFHLNSQEKIIRSTEQLGVVVLGSFFQTNRGTTTLSIN